MHNNSMQQLTIEHENTIEKKKDRREGKGRVLAISCRIYRLQNASDIYYYVESESSDNIYYFVKFKPDVLEEWCCSCKDNSTRGLKCKHLFAIEFAIKWGTIKDIEKLALLSLQVVETKRDSTTTTIVTSPQSTKTYLEDDYNF